MSIKNKKIHERDFFDAKDKGFEVSIYLVLICAFIAILYGSFFADNIHYKVFSRVTLGVIFLFTMPTIWLYYYPRVRNYIKCRPNKIEKILYTDEKTK